MEPGPSNPPEMAPGPSNPPEMTPGPSNTLGSYFTPTMGTNILETIKIIMRFVKRLHSDYLQGNPLENYNHQEFLLPIALLEFIRDNVLQLEGSPLLSAYLRILSKPHPVDSLIQSFMKSFYATEHIIDNPNVMQWVIMCCLVSVVLQARGLYSAENICIETVRGMVCVHGRWDAFRHFSVVI